MDCGRECKHLATYSVKASVARLNCLSLVFFFSSRRRHTRLVSDWSSDVCSSDLGEKDENACPRRRDPSKARRLDRRAGVKHDPQAEKEPQRIAPHGDGAAAAERRDRSEERRVGKECRARWSPDHEKRKRSRNEQQ